MLGEGQDTSLVRVRGTSPVNLPKARADQSPISFASDLMGGNENHNGGSQEPGTNSGSTPEW